jgi:hypothetical protein
VIYFESDLKEALAAYIYWLDRREYGVSHKEKLKEIFGARLI